MLNTLETRQLKPELSTPLNKLVLFICFLMITYFAYQRFDQHKIEQTEASVLILKPKVNDIYFLDMRLLDKKLERKNKYKLAKVIRVTDDSVVIVYGSLFYQWQYSVVNSIEYGDLSNKDYYLTIPEYIPLNKLKEMQGSGAIYLVKRPKQNKVYGNFVSAE